MACSNQPLPVVGALSVWIIARVTTVPPIIVEYFRGPINAWGPEWRSAWMFFDRAEAHRVAVALGCGNVLKVEELDGVLQLDD